MKSLYAKIQPYSFKIEGDMGVLNCQKCWILIKAHKGARGGVINKSTRKKSHVWCQ